MPPKEKFSLLRNILQTFGLSKEAVDDVVERITDWLADKEEKKSPDKIEYPYFIRDDFLSPAELSFYLVLKSAVSEWALPFPKVALGDLFYAKTADYSKYRTYTNKIDRKHVDFLLCDPKTVRPILGIELDDKSHKRPDRTERDEFVEKVFLAAKLPLARVPVKHAYSTTELNALLQQHLSKKGSLPPPAPENVARIEAPRCPKCGSEMVMRTAKSGPNPGEKFWGCIKFPQCRGVLKLES